jgi:threonine/homoserine/homoserine lactone efflux protein
MHYSGADLTDWMPFLLAALALLASPGPTNTLLAASGAAAGFIRSLKLLLAESAGYAIAITVIALLIGPAIAGSPLAGTILKLVASAWLIWSAWHLWREGSDTLARAAPVKFVRVFVTTLLNPKAIVFALVIVPHLKDGRIAEALPYLGALLLLIACVAVCWIATGAAIRASQRADAGLMRKIGAAALALFGVLLSGSVLASAGR